MQRTEKKEQDNWQRVRKKWPCRENWSEDKQERGTRKDENKVKGDQCPSANILPWRSIEVDGFSRSCCRPAVASSYSKRIIYELIYTACPTAQPQACLSETRTAWALECLSEPWILTEFRIIMTRCSCAAHDEYLPGLFLDMSCI